jgi:general secretion pathway protein D
MTILRTYRLRHTALFLPIVFSLMLQSCATPLDAATPAADDIATGAVQPQGTQPARVNDRVAPTTSGASGPIVRQQGGQDVLGHALPQPRGGEAGDVSLNYIDTDVREIVRLILGDILKLNYTIDPGFMGTVTIQTPRPLKREALLPTLQNLLSQTGGIITYQNRSSRMLAPRPVPKSCSCALLPRGN